MFCRGSRNHEALEIMVDPNQNSARAPHPDFRTFSGDELRDAGDLQLTEIFSQAPPANQLPFTVVQLHFTAQPEAKRRQVEPVKNFGKGSRVLSFAVSCRVNHTFPQKAGRPKQFGHGESNPGFGGQMDFAAAVLLPRAAAVYGSGPFMSSLQL
jgi:hypothetical protein